MKVIRITHASQPFLDSYPRCVACSLCTSMLFSPHIPIPIWKGHEPKTLPKLYYTSDPTRPESTFILYVSLQGFLLCKHLPFFLYFTIHYYLPIYTYYLKIFIILLAPNKYITTLHCSYSNSNLILFNYLIFNLYCFIIIAV